MLDAVEWDHLCSAIGLSRHLGVTVAIARLA
jgi:hypothetical protein